MKQIPDEMELMQLCMAAPIQGDILPEVDYSFRIAVYGITCSSSLILVLGIFFLLHSTLTLETG